MRAIITGASSGVGEALASLMASRVPLAGLHLCGRKANNLEAVAARCRSLQAALGDGNKAVITTALGDVGDGQDCARMWAEYRQAHGDSVDVLVANAGLNRVGSLEEMSEADFDLVMNTNVKGVWHWLRHVLPVMKQQRGGQIVVTNSVRGLKGGANSAAYTASKFALRGLTQVTRAECKDAGIKVGAVYPGGIATPWWGDATRGGRSEKTDTSSFLSGEQVAQAIFDIVQQPGESDIEEMRFEGTSWAPYPDNPPKT